jgi:putative ABC transport system permease protein
VDAPSFLRVYDELILPDAQREHFLQDRRGAIVGVALARQFGWKVGDHITLEGTTFAGEWEFSVDGIYTVKRRSVDELSMFFHWSYLNDSLPTQLREQVGWISSKVASAREAPIVAKRIDDVFESRETQTLSMSERAVNNSFMGMASTLLDAIQIVSLVILVIMLLILGNTIAMGVRERTQEYAVLRAIGFLPRHVVIFVLGEATALASAGGLLAVALGVPFINGGVARYLEENMAGFFPFFRLAVRDMLLALVLSGVLAVLAALLPALRASRLQVTDALRKLG